MAMQSTSYSKVDPSAAIALVLAKSIRRKSDQWPYVKDISEIFFRLREAGFRFRGMGLRRIPDGFYSEDVETFVGQLLSMGYATQRSPINLEEDGLKLCEELWAREKEGERDKAEVDRLSEVVDNLLSKSPVAAS
jgi:hypothetical protein